MKVLACVFHEIDFDGRVQRASEALSDIGEVTVLSLDSGRAYHSEKFKSVVIRRPRFIRSQVVTHLKVWFMLWRHALRERPDIVHAHDCFMGFPGWVAAKLAGAKLVFDAHELVIPEPDFKLSVRDWIWYLLERWAIVRADLVIAANQERAAVMVDHYRLRKSPLVIQNIPPRPRSDGMESEGTSDVVRRSQPTDRLIVYQGDVNVVRGLGRFVEAFRYLPHEYRFVLIGGGPSVDALAALARQNDLDGRVVFVKKIPRDSLAGVLRRCDVGVVTYPYEGVDFLLCASNKVYEYAQVGLPMVLTDQVPLKRVVEQYHIGCLVARHDSPREIAAAIQRVVENREEFARNAQEFAAANVWEVEAEKLCEGMLSIGSGRAK